METPVSFGTAMKSECKQSDDGTNVPYPGIPPPLHGLLCSSPGKTPAACVTRALMSDAAGNSENKDSSVIQTNVFIAGGGPAGVGILIRLEREGKLQEILQTPLDGDMVGDVVHPIVVVDKSARYRFGVGKLGKYLCPSNTSAACFVKNVSRKGNDGVVPGEFLQSVESQDTAKGLLSVGSHPADLTEVGSFLGAVSEKLRAERFEHPDSLGKVYLSTSIDSVEVGEDDYFKIYCTRTNTLTQHDQQIVFRAKKVLLALGGKPHYPMNIRLSIDKHIALQTKRLKELTSKVSKPVNKKKPTLPLVLSSDEVMMKDGLKKIFEKLRPLCGGSSIKSLMANPQVLIVGASHSALAAAYLLLKASGGDERLNGHIHLSTNNSKIGAEEKNELRENGKGMYCFKTGDIVMFHRTSPKLFFFNVQNAQSEGFVIDPDQISGRKRVNPHSGLRGPARTLALKIKNGRELRAKYMLCKQENGLMKYLEKFMPRVIIYATGYGAIANDIPFTQHNGGAVEFDLNKIGALNINAQGEVLVKANGSPIALRNCYSVGLGTAYPTDHPAVNGEKGNDSKSADGVNLYQTNYAKHLIPQIWPELERDSFTEQIEENTVSMKEEKKG